MSRNPTKWTGVLGTKGYHPGSLERKWFQFGSTFDLMLRAEGFAPALEQPFIWSGDLDGLPPFFAGNDFEAGIDNLVFYLATLPREDRNVIGHSHGGGIAVRTAKILPINNLITIGTPARKEVREAGRLALASGHLTSWTHVFDKTWDWWGFLGSIGDASFRLSRAMDIPGMEDLKLPGIGHTALLSDRHPEIWRDILLPRLRTPLPEAAGA